jgi:uncharacterized protein
MSPGENKKPNALVNESSPYLLQHAYNPVDWLPFSEKAFEIARSANKPLLISVGYSACHWCHVMEHESFEDQEVADLMNANFVNIKVDREERPDVDMLYMEAVQLMTGSGGWPLNCFVLPDGRPFYGGTYFRKTDWMRILSTLAGLMKDNPAKVNEYADELTHGIHRAESFVTTGRGEGPVTKEQLRESVKKWRKQFDHQFGGPDRAPKFPLPSNYQFLLRYGLIEKDEALLRHVHLTLAQMAFGGINDQLHGGFARYSTDVQWKVPHFEKMLYDNAQLALLYSEAWTHTKNELYRETAEETLAFMKREWYRSEGFFYSAYDADSEGEEGKYYVWTKEELQERLGADYAVFADCYQVNETGYWEHDNYILMRNHDQAGVAMRNHLSQAALSEKIGRCKEKLRNAAEKRVKPGLDDKCITAWNALACSAFARAYLAFGDAGHLAIAETVANFITSTLTHGEHRLWRTYKNRKARINGFLDDYAFTIQALLDVYLATQDLKWLRQAEAYCSSALAHFHNAGSPMLYYTPGDGERLVARTTETSDNVIPASNSQMAMNLCMLGKHLGRTEWEGSAVAMLALTGSELAAYGPGYSNWACLALLLDYPFREIAVVGNSVDEKLRALYSSGITNAILAVSEGSSDLPMLAGRHVPGKTMIYVCENNTCGAPAETIDDALAQLT